jgi:hypothetical protein
VEKYARWIACRYAPDHRPGSIQSRHEAWNSFFFVQSPRDFLECEYLERGLLSHHPCFRVFFDARPDPAARNRGVRITALLEAYKLYRVAIALCQHIEVGRQYVWSPLDRRRVAEHLLEPIASIHDSLRVCLKSRVTSALPSNGSGPDIAQWEVKLSKQRGRRNQQGIHFQYMVSTTGLSIIWWLKLTGLDILYFLGWGFK